MRFIPLGVGDAFTARYYSFSLAVGFAGRWILVDCPHPIRRMLRDAGERAGVALDVGDFEAVILTHLHGDHASGIEGFAYYNYFHRQRARTVVYAHPRAAGQLWPDHCRAGMESPVAQPGDEPRVATQETFFDVRELRLGGAVDVGPFRVEARETHHPVPTAALRLSAGGRTLGVSADTAFDPALIAWLSEADLVVHETNLGIHTPYAKLAALAEPTRSKLRLIHYPDDFPVERSIIPCLREGEPVVV